MKVTILYKPNTETESRVQEYVREFEHQTNKKLKLLDADSKEGIAFAGLYDILQTPAIIAQEEDGHLMNTWTELDKWPTISELSFYTSG